MVKTTKLQRQALKRVFDRILSHWVSQQADFSSPLVPPSYREFRRKVQPGPGCIMVPFHSMWLGIEPDGYTHS